MLSEIIAIVLNLTSSKFLKFVSQTLNLKVKLRIELLGGLLFFVCKLDIFHNGYVGLNLSVQGLDVAPQLFHVTCVCKFGLLDLVHDVFL